MNKVNDFDDRFREKREILLKMLKIIFDYFRDENIQQIYLLTDIVERVEILIEIYGIYRNLATLNNLSKEIQKYI